MSAAERRPDRPCDAFALGDQRVGASYGAGWLVAGIGKSQQFFDKVTEAGGSSGGRGHILASIPYTRRSATPSDAALTTGVLDTLRG